ncbi:MAG TPA: hypothetical protein VII56_17570 [Rhizomicrobium sp.]
MYIYRLKAVLAAEGGVNKLIERAKTAKLSSIWIKVADGSSPFENVTGAMAAPMSQVVAAAQAAGIQVWGWQVPHCPNDQRATIDAQTFCDLAKTFSLDGLIMDAEGGPEYFQGGIGEAKTYATAMRAGADALGKPLAISSNDIPANLPDWAPPFLEIAKVVDFNFPQTYYGGGPSVVNRVDRAVTANAPVTASFVPVGAGYLGSDGGCASASACAEKAREFIRLCNERNYQGYSFWHWGGAPAALWEVLNTVPV